MTIYVHVIVFRGDGRLAVGTIRLCVDHVLIVEVYIIRLHMNDRLTQQLECLFNKGG